jgi:AcrR family transcriptional regulator
MADTRGKVYGGVAASERSAGRRARLLEAALELIGGEGWQGTTVRGVCARAGLSARYFYESFADLDALLMAVFDQVAGDAAMAVIAAVDGSGPVQAREAARAAIAAFVDFVAGDPRKARVLFVEATGSEALQLRRIGALRMFAELIAGEGRRFYGIATGEDTLVSTTALMLAGGLAQTLLAWVEGSLPGSREQIVEDCTAVFEAAGDGAVAVARARAQARS